MDPTWFSGTPLSASKRRHDFAGIDLTLRPWFLQRRSSTRSPCYLSRYAILFCSAVLVVVECSPHRFFVGWMLSTWESRVAISVGIQLQDLRKVADVLGVRTQHARTLLIHHRWDVESLFGKLADVGEDQLFALAGLPPRDGEVEHSVPAGFMCRICYSDVEAEEATMMDCGHGFCNDCKLGLRCPGSNWLC